MPMRTKKNGTASAIGLSPLLGTSHRLNALPRERPRAEHARAASAFEVGADRLWHVRPREALGRLARAAVFVTHAHGDLSVALVRVLHELELDRLHLLFDLRDDVGVGLVPECLRERLLLLFG